MTQPPSPPPPETPPPGASPPPSQPPPPAAPQPAGTRNLMIALSYLGPLALIPLLVEKEDEEVQWHARHGLVLLVAEILATTLLLVAWTMASAVFPPLGCLFYLVALAFFLGIAIVHILAIVKGIHGKRFIVPGLSDLAARF